MSADLVNLPPNRWSEVKEAFRKDWPRNLIGFYLVDNFIRWNQRKPNFEIAFYAIQGDFSEKAAIAITEGKNFYFHATDNALVELKTLLCHLDWSKTSLICGCLIRYRALLGEVIEARNLTIRFEYWTDYCLQPREAALTCNEFSIPDGITLKPLSTEDHIQTAYSVYHFQNGANLDHFRRLMNYNLSVGAFNDKDELVAWCFRYQNGCLTALQTDDRYKRRGLASLVVKEMIRQLSERAEDAFTFVVAKNEASFKLFEKLGFNFMEQASWIGI